MAAARQTIRRQIQDQTGRAGHPLAAPKRRSSRSDVEEEIAVLNEKIKRDLVDLQIQADRLTSKG
jgi:hypothetical protein